MRHYSYPDSIDERKEALRKGTQTLVWLCAFLVWAFILFFAPLNWHPSIPAGVVVAIKILFAVPLAIAAKWAMNPLIERTGVTCTKAYIHIEDSEDELIRYLEEAETLYRDLRSAGETQGRDGAKLLSSLPKLAKEEGARRAEEFLAAEATIRSAVSTRRRLLAERESCRIAAEYYFRYLQKQSFLNFDWAFKDPESLGKFLYLYHTWEEDALRDAKSHNRDIVLAAQAGANVGFATEGSKEDSNKTVSSLRDYRVADAEANRALNAEKKVILSDPTFSNEEKAERCLDLEMIAAARRDKLRSNHGISVQASEEEVLVKWLKAEMAMMGTKSQAQAMLEKQRNENPEMGEMIDELLADLRDGYWKRRRS